ncbi:MAG: hypothetical protein H7Z14_00650 [Anaerolineae bacterium]|nr:hypothetical protein [Phycisphaerae bacterium]
MKVARYIAGQTPRHLAVVVPIAFMALILMIGAGCHAIQPGNVHAVAPVSNAPRAGNAYLLRGFIGIFSTGIDNLGGEIKKSGVNAMVFQDDQWSSLAGTIRKKYSSAPNSEPLVLIGHSYGADDVVRIARELKRDNITVDLLVTLDPVTPPTIPSNVKRCINIYQSNGVWDTLPWLRGVPVEASKNANTELANYNIRVDRTDLFEPGLDHFNIEKKKKVHGEVIKYVLTACPPRNEWAMRTMPAPIASQTGLAIPAAARQGPSMMSTSGAPPVATGQRN